jgi:hypothetical protein
MASTFYNDPVYMESVSAVTASPSVQIGAERMEAGDKYLYVYNTGSSTAGVGRGVIISACTGYSVTVSSITNTGGFIGVVKHAAIPTGSYGWILTRGFTPIIAVADSGIVSGAVLGVGLDGGFTDVPVTNVAALAHGYCVTATASGGTGYGYVRCYGA